MFYMILPGAYVARHEIPAYIAAFAIACWSHAFIFATLPADMPDFRCFRAFASSRFLAADLRAAPSIDAVIFTLCCRYFH